MEELTAIIVDDEDQNIKLMNILISKFCPEVKILNEANNVKEAVTLIEKLNPDIVFLDLEMPGEMGYNLFTYIKNPTFVTIFTTAHTNKLIEHIKSAKFNYLLKPIDFRKLKNTIEEIRLKGKSHFQPSDDQIKSLTHNFDAYN